MLDKMTIAGMLLHRAVLADAQSHIWRRLAEHCVEYGVVSTEGFLEGWRYAAGNEHPANHGIYQIAATILRTER